MDARFYCQASGSPPPVYTWGNRKSQVPSYIYRIKNVSIADVGVYICHARSGNKETKAYAFLSVDGQNGERTNEFIWYWSKYKKLVYRRYRQRSLTFWVLALSISRAHARNVKLRLLFRQYTNLFIFRFVSERCLHSTLPLFHYMI